MFNLAIFCVYKRNFPNVSIKVKLRPSSIVFFKTVEVNKRFGLC